VVVLQRRPCLNTSRQQQLNVPKAMAQEVDQYQRQIIYQPGNIACSPHKLAYIPAVGKAFSSGQFAHFWHFGNQTSFGTQP
jgi:hypothetical protein